MEEEGQLLKLDKIHLKIAYLYMAADGKIESQELAYFNEIGKCYKRFEEEKDSIIKYCDEVLNSGYSAFKAIKKIINGQELKLKNTNAITTDISLFHDFNYFNALQSKENATLLWVLTNLGYADGDYSQPEREIVSLIAKKCNYPDDLLLEFEDIAKTFEVLKKHKEELDEQKKPYSYIKKILFFKIKKTCAGKSKNDIEDELTDISNDYQKLIESIFFLINEWE